MLKSLRENLGLKLISLATSILISVFVASQHVQPEARREIAADVQTVGASPEDLLVSVRAEPVQVELVGPRSEVDGIDPSAVRVRVDISAARLGSRELRIRTPVAPPAGAANVVVRPLRQTVAVDVLAKRRKRMAIATSFTNDPPAGMRFAAPRLSPAWADVVGPETEVRKVARLVVYIETEGGAVRTNVPIRPLDRNGVVLDTVKLDPQSTSADVGLLTAPATRTLVVSAAHTGRPATGYEIRDVVVEPQQVTLTGIASVLQTLTSVKTVEFSIDGIKGDRAYDVPFQVPAGVVISGGPARAHVVVTMREVPRPATKPE